MLLKYWLMYVKLNLIDTKELLVNRQRNNKKLKNILLPHFKLHKDSSTQTKHSLTTFQTT